MIPPLTPSGYLPPYIGGNPTLARGMAPYPTTVTELGKAFAVTPQRLEAFKGLLNLRQKLRVEGISAGFQWIDGSYVEACERLRGRTPDDIDVVTFFKRPEKCKDGAAWSEFFQTRFRSQFDRHVLKRDTRCDAYFEDLDLPGRVIVSRARYWFGLFSHQRFNGTWKGLLEIRLTDHDREAWEWLAAIEASR